MKKSIKILLAVTIVISMCLCLGGCRQLDDLRATHGYWTNENNKDSITLNGKEYIKAEGENIRLILNRANNISPITVTDKDVPVLLSITPLGKQFSISNDQKFIFGSIVTDESVDGYVTSVSTTLDEKAVYIRKDVYNKLKDKLNGEIEYTKHGFYYFYYDEKEDTDKIKYYNFTDSENEMINEILTTVEPEKNIELPYNFACISCIEKISEDDLFADSACDLYYDTVSGKFYLVIYNDADEDYSLMVYEVPQQYNNTMKKFTDKLKYDLEMSGIHIK